MSKKGFEKFITKELKGAKKKEAIRQEKKQYNREKRAFFEEQKRLKRLQEQGGYAETPRYTKSQDKKFGEQEKRNRYQKNDTPGEQRKSFDKKNTKSKYDKEPVKEDRINKRPPATKPVEDKRRNESFENRKDTVGKKESIEKKYPRKHDNTKEHGKIKEQSEEYKERKRDVIERSFPDKKKSERKDKPDTEKMPLNKYLAHAGVCARREAAGLIKEGMVKVNNSIVSEPGYKVQPGDSISFKGKTLQLQHRLVYILLNKPKDYITTSKDPEGRRTVFELVQNATEERIYPVGRLDRNTTGVLLFTNDGELAQRLTHPSFQVRKIYEVKLNKVLSKEDFQKLSNGITLDDGFIQPDALGYADAKDKTKIGIEIHSGRNRIVRRMFEYLGYDVRNLDRVLFANLTKKNIERGHWRHLTEKEVRLLKYMNKSFIKKESK